VTDIGFVTKAAFYSQPARVDWVASAKAAGATVSEFSRGHGLVPASCRKWQTQYDGTEANEVRRLRELEVENDQLKKLLGETHRAIEAPLCRLAQCL